jgi:hypothetical protein
MKFINFNHKLNMLAIDRTINFLSNYPFTMTCVMHTIVPITIKALRELEHIHENQAMKVVCSLTVYFGAGMLFAKQLYQLGIEPNWKNCVLLAISVATFAVTIFDYDRNLSILVKSPHSGPIVFFSRH